MMRTRSASLRTAFASLALLISCGLLAAQQGSQSLTFHFVANTTPPDAYLALRTLPSSRGGRRIMAMSNGTLLQVLQRRDDGWWRVRVSPSGQEGWALSGRGNRVWIDCCKTLTGSAPVQPSQTELPGLRTPSNNIHCLIEEWKRDDGKQVSQLRCDISDLGGPPPPKPAQCEFDWGQVFAIAADGLSGQRLCYSDSAMNEGYRVLPYGAIWQRGGYTCRSESSGLTCVNALGHGFALSKREQRLF